MSQDGPITAAQLLAGPLSPSGDQAAQHTALPQQSDAEIQAFWLSQQHQPAQQPFYAGQQAQLGVQSSQPPESDYATLQRKLQQYAIAGAAGIDSARQQAPARQADLTAMLQQHAAHDASCSQQDDQRLTALLSDASHVHTGMAPGHAQQYGNYDNDQSYMQQIEALQGLARAQDQPRAHRQLSGAQAMQGHGGLPTQGHSGEHAYGNAASLEEQLSAMHADSGLERTGDADPDDGRYLEMLMQNAMSNLSRAQDQPAPHGFQ